jgi:HSP20 family protein
MLSALFPRTIRTNDLATLSRQMDRLLSAAGVPSWPGINIWRNGDTIVAEAEIPGFKLEDVEVLATEDTLTLRGRRTAVNPENATAMRTERLTTKFDRTIQFPLQVQPDAVQATLADGVLRVTLPVAAAALPRKVTIKPAAAAPDASNTQK